MVSVGVVGGNPPPASGDDGGNFVGGPGGKGGRLGGRAVIAERENREHGIDRKLRPVGRGRPDGALRYAGLRAPSSNGKARFPMCYGPEFIAKAVQDWIAAVGAKTASIAPGSPREDGYIESFNARLRDELLDGEIFYTLAEAKIVVESWRRHYNTVRPHGPLGYKPPVGGKQGQAEHVRDVGHVQLLGSGKFGDGGEPA